MAGGLKFRILEVEGLYYPCSENTGADRSASLFSRLQKKRFSHDAAHYSKPNAYFLFLLLTINCGYSLY